MTYKIYNFVKNKSYSFIRKQRYQHIDIPYPELKVYHVVTAFNKLEGMYKNIIELENKIRNSKFGVERIWIRGNYIIVNYGNKVIRPIAKIEYFEPFNNYWTLI